MNTLLRRFGPLLLFASSICSGALLAAPTITRPPGVVTATTGTTATFSVDATGAGALRYQWRRAGAPIVGANGPTYSISPVGLGDEGAYDVEVSDDSGLPVVSGPGWLVYRAAAGRLWGAGLVSSLGGGNSGGWSTPRRIAKDVTRVFAGSSRTFFLKTDGTLWATGTNFAGALGDGTTEHRLLPVLVATDVAEVAAGASHTLLLKRDHSLWAVGANSSGQLGNNTTVNSVTPVHVADGVAHAAAGRDHSAFITLTGELWVWGSGSAGKLGLGDSNNRLTPQFLTAGVKEVAAGPNYTVFVRSDSSLWGMGMWSSSAPVRLRSGVRSATVGISYIFVVGVDGSLDVRSISGFTSQLIYDAVEAVAADLYGDAWALRRRDGQAWSFGPGLGLKLANGAITPLGDSIKEIAVGSGQILAVDARGDLFAYGNYGGGALGVGLDETQSSPALLQDGIVAASTGGNHSLSLAANGDLWAAGSNSAGQLGTATPALRITPAVCASGVRQVASGGNRTLYIDSTGQLWSVGAGGGLTDQSIPYPVASGVVTCAGSPNHSLFITSEGELRGMGSNQYGQLGNRVFLGSSSIAPVPIAWGVVACAAGAGHTLFIKADGSLWALGYNNAGQLGDGTTTARTAPVQVATGVVSVSAGHYFSLFRTVDGTLWGMGANNSGQFGDGTTTSRLLPTPISNDVVAFRAGAEHTLFLKADGSLWTAGLNTNGQLADGTVAPSAVRKKVADDVSAIAAGGNVSLFVQRAGAGSEATILVPPQSQTVSAGATCRFTVSATGTGPVGYQWYKDGVALPGENNPELTVVCVDAVSAGSYAVEAIATAGRVRSPAAILIVGPAPAIVPSSSSIAAGASTTLTVDASGTGDLSYQWWHDGGAISGATGLALTIANPPLSALGYYQVVVTDDYASNFSDPAALSWPSFPIAPAETDQFALGAAFDGTNFVVAIQGTEGNATATTAQLVAPDGGLVGGRISFGRNGGEAGNGLGGVKVACDGANSLLVWADNAGAPTLRLWGAFVSKAGAVVGEPFAFPVAGGASMVQRPQGIAFDGIRYLIVYSDGESKPWRLCGRFVSPAGVVGAEMELATDTVDSFQAVASNGSGFFVAWPAWLGDQQYGAQGRFVSGTGTLSAVVALDSEPSPSYNPLAVASDGIDYLVVWNHDTGPGLPAPTAWELRSRIVRAGGSLPAAPVTLCDRMLDPVLPAIAFDGDAYLVTWSQTRAGGFAAVLGGDATPGSTGLDAGGCRLHGDGTMLGAKFDLVVGPGNQGLTSTAAGAGKCLVVYNTPWMAAGSEVRGLLLPASTGPTITSQPVSQDVAAGGGAVFSVEAAGEELRYQWYRGDSGDTTDPIDGATGPAYVTPALSAWARFWVRVTGSAGRADSRTALVRVAGAPMTLADWVAQAPLSAEQQAPLATPAEDGVANLLKYVLGVLPLESAAERLPALQVIQNQDRPLALGFVFTANPGVRGVRYALEASADLMTWNEVPSSAEVLETNPDSSFVLLVRESQPAVTDKRFVRLKLLLAE